MCGIVCGVSSTLKEEEIKISLQKINHRGPDEQDYYRKHDLFLGHARLSIVDINGAVSYTHLTLPTIYSV